MTPMEGVAMKTPFDFADYRVAIAGGSRGIGRAMALDFLEAGAQVAVCARGQQGLDALRTDAGAHSECLHTHTCDLAEANQIERWVADAAGAMGGMDILVNNATGYGFREDDESWLVDFNVDLMAAVRASRHALPHLQRSQHPCILHTSSIGSLRPRTMGPPYAAMKAALNHYTTTQALALAGDRIRVNAIAPGAIEFVGGVWDRVKREKPDQYAEVLATIPFGRFGTADEVAHLALFLASPLAGWITGQIMVVDGGQFLRS
jgi:3-oxoacyl-[acyl-carrier protein] reductase